MRDVSEEVKDAVYQAGLGFLKRHDFLVETKSGVERIVFTTGVPSRPYLWQQGYDALFVAFAEQAGKAHMKNLALLTIPHQKDVFNEGIGRAMVEYMAFKKGCSMEIEMQPVISPA